MRASQRYGLEVNGTGVINDLTVSSDSSFASHILGAINITNENVAVFHLDDSIIGEGIGLANANPIVNASAVKVKISGNTFNNNSGLVDIKATRASLSGVLLLTSNIFNTSGSLTSVDEANYLSVIYKSNSGIPDNTRSYSDKGSETALTTSAYGSVFASSNIFVTFSEELNSIPEINFEQVLGGGVLSASATSVTTLGFTMLIYGVVNGGSATVKWTAFT
jgi:hypothetical protein